MTRRIVTVLPEPDIDWQIGRARRMRTGADVTLAACGVMVAAALEAADALSQQSISADVLNFHTLKPFDRVALIESARRTGRVVVAEEHNIFGGLGSIAARVLSEEYPIPMRFIAAQDTFGESGKPEELMQKYGLTSAHIIAAALELI